MEGGSSTGGNASSRLKRVLPSRSRRGGPGLGTCEVDNLILETMKRKFENEPLIPADTSFLLTTDPAYSAEPSEASLSGIKINIVANDRYFDRPDVLKAFREQAIIQTPHFEAIQDVVSGVGGRFRPRQQDDANAETSDAAYEKRHKKFESYEKRQRIRERDKLKHEHYKLKERIEQLRAMDGAAFMTLPESSFSPAPQVAASNIEDPVSSMGTNGGMYHAEGERRRKEMLDIASTLERRYAYLLPPERMRKNQDVPSPAIALTQDIDSRDDDLSDAGKPPTFRRDTLKLRIPGMRSSTSSTPAPSPVPFKPSAPKKTRTGPPLPSRTANVKAQKKVSPPLELSPVEEQFHRTSVPSTSVEIEPPGMERATSPPLSPPSSPPSPKQKRKALSPTPSNKSNDNSNELAPDPLNQGSPLSEPPIETALAEIEEPAFTSLETKVAEEAVNEEVFPPRESFVSKDSKLVLINDDGESERALSDAGEEVDQLADDDEPATIAHPKKKRGPKPKAKGPKSKGKAKAVSAAPEKEQQVPFTSPDGKRKRSRKSRRKTPESDPPDHRTEDPVEEDLDFMEKIGEMAEPEWQRTRSEEVLPPSEAADAQEIISVTDRPTAPIADESISTRASKRRRKDQEHVLDTVLTQRTPSAQPSERLSIATARRRGQPFVDYFSEAANEKVRTWSTLIIAATRATESVRRAGKERYAFGAATPEFHKQPEVDFDLPIYFRFSREPTVSVVGEEDEDLVTQSHQGFGTDKEAEGENCLALGQEEQREVSVGEPMDVETPEGDNEPPQILGSDFKQSNGIALAPGTDESEGTSPASTLEFDARVRLLKTSYVRDEEEEEVDYS